MGNNPNNPVASGSSLPCALPPPARSPKSHIGFDNMGMGRAASVGRTGSRARTGSSSSRGAWAPDGPQRWGSVAVSSADGPSATRLVRALAPCCVALSRSPALPFRPNDGCQRSAGVKCCE